MRGKMLLGVFLICASLAMGAENEFFQEESIVTTRLEESVITSERFETTARNTPKNTTIITREDIEKKGAKDVIEALKGVPGINAKNGFGSGSVDIRGQGDTQVSNVLILVDGVPQNSLDLSGPRIRNIAIQNVERIEVIPSGGAVLYGDGAVGGVVNIITRSKASNEGYGSVSMEAGSDGMFNYGASYSGKASENVMINLSYFDNNKDGYRENGDYDTKSFEVGGKYLISETESILFKYARNEEEYGMPGSLTKSEVDADRTQAESSLEYGTNDVDSYTMSGNKAITENLEFLMDFNYKEGDSYFKNDGGIYTYDRTDDSKQLTVKPMLKFTYAEDSYLIGGFSYLNGETITEYPDYNLSSKYEKEAKGYFILNKYTWNKLQFTQGYRHEDTKYEFSDGAEFLNDKDYNNRAAELAVNYLYSDTGSTFISFNKGFRTAKTDELYSESADNILEPQTFETIELGVKDYIFNSYISTSIFKTLTEDEIFYNKLEYQNENIDGETERLGLEIFAEQYLGKFTLRESFTYIDHEIKDGDYEGNEIPGVSSHQYSIGGTYDYNSNLSFDTGLNYYGSAYASADFDNSVGKVDSYITVDFKVSYDFKNGLFLYGGVDNIFGEEYYEYVGYTTVSGYTDNKSYYPASERTYYVGAKYNF
ncbi:TonB-dependent receptor [uncultured Ilyobacter sp.]|uniref:TonB-dependent receptor family protein n=1 Tax=uncultured Ilyobacter sp. TaxID=544433 RepID=UPI0029F5570B|nr:TonB-dependent receptor [uncultured Ilyobacter sp.]